MSKKVKLKDQLGRVIRITDDVKGATVGKDLRWPDGSVVQATEIRQSTSPSSNASPTLWKLIREIPANIQALAAMVLAGFPTRAADGTWSQRSIVGVAGEIEVADGDGAGGNPTLGLADVPDTGTGVLQLTSFDAKGRKTGTAAATTDNLAQGTTNLYFPEAPNDGQQYARQSLGWTAVESFNYDDLKASLVAGANITITPDDLAQTLTITGTGGGGGGGVATVTGGTGVTVNNTDPSNPVVALSSAAQASLALADSSLQPAAIGTTVQAHSANLDSWALLAPSAKANAGAIGSSGLTMATARILGRTTAGTGAPEEITVGSGLSLSGGTLSATGGGGSGTVTSVGISGSTGLTVGGTNPITTSGTISLTLSANLQAFSGIAIPGNTTTFLRGDGTWSNSLTGSLAITGNVQTGASGTFISGSGFFRALTNNVILATNGAASVYFRPNGEGSTTGQMFLNSAGDLISSNGKFFGADTNHYIDVGIGGTNRMELGAYLGVYNFYNTQSAATEIQFNAGNINMQKAASEFYRAAANSTTTTRQPRIFVGGGDPGAAMANGDIWIP